MQNITATPRDTFTELLGKNVPQAMAWVQGGPAAPSLSGLVKFFATPYGGVLVEAEVFGLPNIGTPGSTDFYAMHIHQYGNCAGTASDPFANTGEHYNPTGAPHPSHEGDLLPLLGNQGYAWLAFYDKRFTIPEIIGKSVVIHKFSDDFRTQPSGNSGAKIACGEIRSTNFELAF